MLNALLRLQLGVDLGRSGSYIVSPAVSPSPTSKPETEIEQQSYLRQQRGLPKMTSFPYQL